MSEKLTITLSNARPVTVDTAEWPVLARATCDTHDGNFECQALRKTKRRLVVRAKGDRYVVYGVYDHTSAWQGERDVEERVGRLHDGSIDSLAVVISEVASELIDRTGDDLIAKLGRECIADLPAVQL